MTKPDGKKTLALGAIFGAVVGFLTGILTAPKSGKETRQDIKETAGKLSDSTEKELKKLYRELTSHADTIRKGLDTLAGKAKKDAEQALLKIDASLDKIKGLLSTIRDGEADEKAIDKVIKHATDLGDSLKTKSTEK